ncbi:uncharacterized protein RCC_06472 [Ramularia collo-cygni]|uniref:Uncharacterized protein n=1 Tax=Ramularia collo-cygni TaxID=112498 RepID=A0A2D3VCW9_9PEZI|nr:uncharacterized protein RCC_06472 [Ramularia collo-cygni]CZT20614.1 uncharacterized protein RCC_06472 [Ramularia collo-cygni]
MKSVIAILAVALTVSGVMAAPTACPKKETPVATYGEYEHVPLPEHYGKYDSYGKYKDAPLPEHFGKYSTYGHYERDAEAAKE